MLYLTILKCHVATITRTKFELNPTYGSGGNGINQNCLGQFRGIRPLIHRTHHVHRGSTLIL